MPNWFYPKDHLGLAKNAGPVSREMTQQLRTPVALPEDQVLIPSTYVSVTPVPRDLIPSSGFCRHYMYVLHRHTYKQNTYIHKITNKFSK